MADSSYKGQDEFSSANQARVNRLRDAMRATQTPNSTVQSKMAAESSYYNDPVVKRQGKRIYQETSAALRAEQQAKSDQEMDRVTSLPSYKHGGIVKRTGPAFLHKGETVVPKNPDAPLRMMNALGMMRGTKPPAKHKKDMLKSALMKPTSNALLSPNS